MQTIRSFKRNQKMKCRWKTYLFPKFFSPYFTLADFQDFECHAEKFGFGEKTSPRRGG